MAQDDDLPEFTGVDHKHRATPKPTRAAAAPPAPLAVAPAPVAPLAAHVTKPGHPHHAKLRPMQEWHASQIEVAEAREALVLAERANATAARVEADCLLAWMKINPPPTQDQVTREWIERSQAARKLAVEESRDPDAVAAPLIGKAPIDVHALNRQKSVRGTQSAPLRSNVVRR